jgi:hypothetical protein
VPTSAMRAATVPPRVVPAGGEPTSVPVIPRTRRRRVPDPRLVVGLVLVLASVAGVVALLRAADSTVGVYAASAALVPGQHVSASDLVQRDVVLDGADRHYVRVGSLPAGGLVIRTPVAAGELVPASAVGDAAKSGLTSMVVSVDGEVPSQIRAGAAADLWAAPTSDSGDRPAEPPSVLVSGAVVAEVRTGSGLVAGDGVDVELLLPQTRVARVLQAQADGARLSVVPSGIAGGS